MSVKLGYREFAVDSGIPNCDSDATTFWLEVRSMKSPSEDFKYQKLSLQLLSLPASNADCEQVFSLVRRIKTDFRSAYTQTQFYQSLVSISIHLSIAVSSLPF